ncbi:unnamed protein product [Parnassius apollo]|uniref:(apollo) hypothetical protein n=1 Tax=Parnassius apollo TaxID=110799 RepID=A0A8S3X455_PARAO|nr:unnamed protein product [Parnassius apollo]
MLTCNTLEKSQNNSSQQISVPKLVPAANNIATNSNIITQTNTIAPGKPQQTNNILPKSVSNSPTTQKPEKRPRQLSVTVNLTDDEPPTKMASRSSPVPPVRYIPPQNLIAPRYPAPLPDAMKQYQPPNWKALPPPPNLKLSKVENGITISWKIDGYENDNYEEIASYQLYVYLETTSPPSTELWKKRTEYGNHSQTLGL